jgi:diguanylate cyclase (GGDEF)-like protein
MRLQETLRKLGTGSDRLNVLIKSAYWIALMIIAGMAMGSYVILQQMLAAQQDDQATLGLASSQKALSQRIVMLANAAESAPADVRTRMIAGLKAATEDFELNYDALLKRVETDLTSVDKHNPGSIGGILFGQPHHLDYFSTNLAANSWRLIAALESSVGERGIGGSYLAGTERARLDEKVATATMEGYSALAAGINALSQERLNRLLRLHSIFFYMTIAVIVLVTLFIFRPMSEMIMRRTRDLIEARNSMAFLAVHDSLTGLHNRTFLTDHFETLLRGAQRKGEKLAVVQIDLDRFKQINDTLGHAVGDHVLVRTGQRLREEARASDMCVRLGGDEFVMILKGVADMHDVDAAVRRILRLLNEPIRALGATIHPGASAGVALYPDDADTAAALLINADLALYSAKKRGGGSHCFFSSEQRRELDERQRLEMDLRAAIAERAFGVHFQPQVSLTTSATIGVEALVRWTHPVRGVVSPCDFVPVAEKIGLMAQVGRIVLERSIKAAAEWHRRGIDFGRIAVNVSGTELREADFETFLFDTLRTAGLPTQRFALEIVESVILDDVKSGIAEKLRRIRMSGIHLELDDFGTGYASLTHVNPAEIDRLKIDRRFVHDIHRKPDNAMIVKAITDLAKGLGISVVAEGAESAEELAALQGLGCDQVQGYSIAVPMPETGLRDWLLTRSPRKDKLKLLHGHRA